MEPLKGARNAVLFGTKIRLVDGVVKAILYHNGTMSDAVKQVVDVAFEHGSSLALQVFLHKLILLVLRKIQGQELPWHWAFGGCLSGGLALGRQTRFNEMLNLYLFSRVLVAFAKSLQVPEWASQHGHRVWSACIWAAVMYQFRTQMPIQSTLATTMSYLHDDALLHGWASWGPNLGSGAKIVPFAAILVWALKLCSFSRTRHQVERVPSFPENLC